VRRWGGQTGGVDEKKFINEVLRGNKRAVFQALLTGSVPSPTE
jgi:hypothetical protein